MSDPTRPIASYDLHLHTYWSYDASAEPTSYFRAAEQLGMRCIAITEHHVLDGWEDTIAAARRYPSVKWLMGAELTVNTTFGSVDLLCYRLPRNRPAPLKEVLGEYHEWQQACGTAISRGMEALGFRYGDTQRRTLLKDYRPAKTIRAQGYTHVRNGAQRSHFLHKRFIATAEEYKEVLSQAGQEEPRPTYPEASRVVPVLKQVGALIAMAHPHGHCPNAGSAKLDALREECGLDGFECAHKSMPPELSPRFREYCVQQGLFSVAGSDCHLDHETRTLLGRHGGREEWLDEFLERLT